MPTPILILIIVLIGYPLVQAVSAYYLKPKRLRAKALERDLRADSDYAKEDLEALDWAAKIDRPHFAFMLAVPVLLPLVALGSAWQFASDSEISVRSIERGNELDRKSLAELLSPGITKRPIWHDPRFQELHLLSSELEFNRMPITMCLAVATVGFFLPMAVLVGVIAYGLKFSRITAQRYSDFVDMSVRKGATVLNVAFGATRSRH